MAVSPLHALFKVSHVGVGHLWDKVGQKLNRNLITAINATFT